MVSVKRPNNPFRSGPSKPLPQKSLLSIKNIFLAIICLALANVLVKRIFPKRVHPQQPVPRDGAKTLHDVWQDQQKLRGQQQPAAGAERVQVEQGHPKEHATAVEQEHSDADDHVDKKVIVDGKDEAVAAKPNEPEHPVDIEHHDEMVVQAIKEADQAVLPNEKPAAVVDEPVEQPEAHQQPPEQQQQQQQQQQPKEAAPPNDANQVVLRKLGTGPTAHGYVVDLVDERNHPQFRTHTIPDDYYTKLAQKVESLHGTKVESCEYYDATHKTLKQRDTCHDADTRLVAYNDADFTRYLCGQAIAPGQAVALSGEPCHEPAHLFPQDSVPITGHSMPAIQVVKSPDAAAAMSDKLDKIECDIPCEYEPDLPVDQYIAGTKWHLKVSDKDPGSEPNARIEKSAFRQDLYYSTTSLKSSVPLSYYNASLHSIRNRPAANWETAASKASFFVDKDCYQGSSRRMKWLSVIETQLTTEAYGSCGHNTDVSKDETIATLEGRLKLSKQNRIHLAFEESTEKDHITDTVWESLLSGAVPAVLGSSNIAQYLPPHSIIDSTLFNSWDKYSEYVKSVSENKTLWESYQKWRTDEDALKTFESRMKFTEVSAQCRTCRWAFAKLYGLGWDHYQQVVRETTTPRQLCIDKTTGMASQPFRESWGAVAVPAAGSGNCESLTGETVIGSLKRTLVQHDGVVDMTFTSTSDAAAVADVVIRLQTAVRNSEGAYFPYTHALISTVRGYLTSSATIQDEGSRVTVVVSWETVIRSPEEGMIEVVVQRQGEFMAKDAGRRIRIITEDMHPITDKMTEFFPSSFCKRMVKDFVDPIDLFSAQV